MQVFILPFTVFFSSDVWCTADICGAHRMKACPPLSGWHLWFWAVPHQLWDGLPRNMVQTFVFPSGLTAATLVILWLWGQISVRPILWFSTVFASQLYFWSFLDDEDLFPVFIQFSFLFARCKNTERTESLIQMKREELKKTLNNYFKCIQTRYESTTFGGSSSCKSAASELLWSVYSCLPLEPIVVWSGGEADSETWTTKACALSVCRGISAPWPLGHCHQICTELQ